MAAKVESKKKSYGLPMPMEAKDYVSPTTLSVNLEKFSSLNGYDVGDICEGTFKGKVTSIRKDKYSEDMTIEITMLKKGAINGDSED